MNKTVGFDLDGVIFDMEPIIREQALEHFGKEAPDGVITCYSLEEVYGLTYKQVRELILICQEDRHLTPDRFIPGAQEALTRFAGKGNPVVVITARPIIEPVEKFLREHLDVDPRKISVHFSHSKDKGQCAYSMGIETFLDDYWESLLSLMNYGIEPLLFNQSWNRELPSERSLAFSNVKRIRDWEHFMEQL